MSVESRTMSWWDAVRFHALITLPTGLLGLVVPNRFVLGVLARWDLPRLAAGFVTGLRRKYGCGHLWLWFPRARTMLVLDRESFDAVLASRDNAADPWLKKKALSGFVPDALVISSGAAWADRRPFNETVLGFAAPLPNAEAFTNVVSSTLARLVSERERRLRWADFQRLALEISHQVILGKGEVQPGLAADLARLASASNLLIRRTSDFDDFYARLDRLLQQHRAPAAPGAKRPPGSTTGSAECLLHGAASMLDDGSATSSTCVPNQAGFWFFVLKDALELHVARTLALITAHPTIQDRVRRELDPLPLSAAAITDAMPLLDACIREQLRLWTPVPILLRRAVRDFVLRDAIAVAAEQQLLMLPGVYHRDTQVFGAAADRFSPELHAGSVPALYVFSAGPQSCAGQFLAMFLLKATLAALLKSFRFELVAPRLRPERIPYAIDHFAIELVALGDGPQAR